MDLSITTKPENREFLAIILAGYGQGLAPLTRDHGEEPCPKALIPVANKPVIDYVLAWLETSGVKDAMIICPAVHREAISHHIHSDISLSLNIELQPHDDPDADTGQLLRDFSHKIKDDFIILPCDFIPPPSMPLSILLDKFRAGSITLGPLITSFWFFSPQSEKGAFPDDWSPLPKSAVVWDDQTHRLLHVDTSDQTEQSPETIILPMSILSQYPNARLSRNLQDSHVYICRKLVMDILLEKRNLDSFRDDFLPWICHRRGLHHQKLNAVSASFTVALSHSTLGKSSARWDSSVEVDSAPNLSVGMHILRTSEWTARINNLSAFMEMNRHFLTQTLAVDTKDRGVADSTKSQVSLDSLIEPSAQISERTTIKKSVIGKHCKIGKMVKISGCIFLDHCVVDDGAKLDGCILGKNTKVGSKAMLTRCATQAGYEVAEGANLKNENLESSDWNGDLDEDEE